MRTVTINPIGEIAIMTQNPETKRQLVLFQPDHEVGSNNRAMFVSLLGYMVKSEKFDSGFSATFTFSSICCDYLSSYFLPMRVLPLFLLGFSSRRPSFSLSRHIGIMAFLTPARIAIFPVLVQSKLAQWFNLFTLATLFTFFHNVNYIARKWLCQSSTLKMAGRD